MLIASFSFVACNQSGKQSIDKQEDQTLQTSSVANKTLEFNVQGMTCEGCENSIEKKLIGLEGIVTAEASHTAALAKVSFDSTKVSTEQITTAINSLGYQTIDFK